MELLMLAVQEQLKRGETFFTNKLDCVYLVKGVEKVSLKVKTHLLRQYFIFISPWARHTNHLMKKEEASPVTIEIQKHESSHDIQIHSC
jgi:hypothetical protein